MQEFIILIETHGIWTVLSAVLLYLLYKFTPTLLEKLKDWKEETFDLKNHSFINYVNKLKNQKEYQYWAFKDKKRKRLAEDFLSIYINHYSVFIKEVFEYKSLDDFIKDKLNKKIQKLDDSVRGVAINKGIPEIYINKVLTILAESQQILLDSIYSVSRENLKSVHKMKDVFTIMQLLLHMQIKTLEKVLIKLNGEIDKIEYPIR